MTHFVRKALLRYIIDFLFFREFHAMENAFSKIETSCVSFVIISLYTQDSCFPTTKMYRKLFQFLSETNLAQTRRTLG